MITKQVTDFSVLPLGAAGGGATVVKIPAPLVCYFGLAFRKERRQVSNKNNEKAKG